MSRTITCQICGTTRHEDTEECECGFDDSVEEDYERYLKQENERGYSKGDLLRDEERDNKL